MAEALYGATVDDVRALLPHRRIDHTSKPSAEQVEGFLAFTASEVATRVTLLTLAGASTTVIAAAELMGKGLTALGAAAMAEDAGHPEQTGRGASSYGGVLWERYTGRLDGLADLLDIDEDAGGGGGDGPGGVAAAPAYSFPDPTFRSTTRF